MLQEMAKLPKSYTGLPYDVWIDSKGKDRVLQHNKPRLKVKVNGNRIPVSIEDPPEILVKSTSSIPGFNEISKWIIGKKDVLLKHWKGEINDREAIDLLKKS